MVDNTIIMGKHFGNNHLNQIRGAALYTQTEASAYLSIPKSTLRYWALGEKTKLRYVLPLIEGVDTSKRLSFFNLVELHILNSLRKDFNIDLPKIRKTLDYVKKKIKAKRPLIDQEFETDGVDLFVTEYGQLINVSKEGQQAMRAVLQSSLQRVERDNLKIPIKLFPYTHSSQEKNPRIISINPSIFSGRPVIDGTGVSTTVIAERYKAGDSLEMLVEDYGLSQSQIQEALRCEMPLAA